MKKEEEDDTTDFISPVLLTESVKETVQLEQQGIVEKGTSKKLFIFLCVLFFVGTFVASTFRLGETKIVSTASLNGTE